MTTMWSLHPLRRLPGPAVPLGFLLALLWGCEGETGPQPVSVSADVASAIAVSVQPQVAGVNIKTTRRFAATVTDDPKHAGVRWRVTGTGCTGTACGTVLPTRSDSGVKVTYTAPSLVPHPAEVHLTATSITDTTRSAFATVFVTTPGVISVAVIPSSAFIMYNRRNPGDSVRLLHFTGYVFNDPSSAGLTWSAKLGPISPTHSASGQGVTYRASRSHLGVDTVKAKSVANPTKFARAFVHSALSSCPLVYSWDGKHWRLDSGTFGGAIVRALTRSDFDNLDFATTQHGILRLKLADELDETDYVDGLTVLAVDHDSRVTVAPDAVGRLYSLRHMMPPNRARDFRGDDVLSLVSAADGRSWESSAAPRDTAVSADIRDGIELSFSKPAAARTARLVVDANNSPWAAEMMQAFIAAHGRATQAWYDSLNAAPKLARRMFAKLAREAFLSVSVRIAGRWQRQGAVWEAGPEIVKRQVVPLDLSRVRGKTVRIRLESVPNFWLVDHVALDLSRPRPFKVTRLSPMTALDQRGQDVRGLLAPVDGRFFSMETGDFAEVHYLVPKLPAGRARTFVLRSTGYYRIHSPEVGKPDVALLNRVLTEPYAISRIAVARMNQMLLALHGAKQ